MLTVELTEAFVAGSDKDGMTFLVSCACRSVLVAVVVEFMNKTRVCFIYC